MITKLQKIGFIVASTVCDQGPANQKAIRLLREEAHKKTGRIEPEIIVNEKTIITFWDTPHNLKNILNNLRNHDEGLEYGPAHDRKRACYQHIIDYYEFDQKEFKVGLLSYEQVYPQGKKKMKVINTARVLSSTLGNTMKSYNAVSTRNGGDPILPGIYS